MLRTNDRFLCHIEELYKNQNGGEHIFLKSYLPDQLLVKQGARPSKVIILKKGIVSCFISEENGKDFIVEFLSRGEIIGEIEAIRNTPCICSVRPLTPVEAYSVRLPLFKTLLEKDSNFNRLLLESLSDRIINTSGRAAFRQLHPLEHGLIKLLELQRNEKMTLSKEQMAAYLGVSVRSLNRQLRTLKK